MLLSHQAQLENKWIPNYNLMLPSFRTLFALSDAWKIKAPRPLFHMQLNGKTRQCHYFPNQRWMEKSIRHKQTDKARWQEQEWLFHTTKTIIWIWTKEYLKGEKKSVHLILIIPWLWVNRCQYGIFFPERHLSICR